jgi:hypothetical protein
MQAAFALSAASRSGPPHPASTPAANTAAIVNVTVADLTLVITETIPHETVEVYRGRASSIAAHVPQAEPPAGRR